MGKPSGDEVYGGTVDEIRESVSAAVTADCPNCAGLVDATCMECEWAIDESLEITGDKCECQEEYGFVCRAHREEEEAHRREEREAEFERWDKYGMGTSWDEWQDIQKRAAAAARGEK